MAYKCDFQREQEAVIPAIFEASFAETWSFCGIFGQKLENDSLPEIITLISQSLVSLQFFQKSCLYLNVFYIQLPDRHVWL